MEKIVLSFPCPHCNEEIKTTGNVKINENDWPMFNVIIDDYLCPHCGNIICSDEEELEE